MADQTAEHYACMKVSASGKRRRLDQTLIYLTVKLWGITQSSVVVVMSSRPNDKYLCFLRMQEQEIMWHPGFHSRYRPPRSSAFTGTYSRVSSALSVHHRHQSCYKCRLFILKGFHFPSLSKSRRKCISSEVPISHLPCYPRIGSQAWESVTNLKISDEAAPKCFTSNTFSFSFSKAKKEMHHFRIDSRHQRDLKLLWSG